VGRKTTPTPHGRASPQAFSHQPKRGEVELVLARVDAVPPAQIKKEEGGGGKKENGREGSGKGGEEESQNGDSPNN